MKQDIIICPGIPKSGTTSLWKFLKLNGFNISEKESHYLTELYGETTTDEFEDKSKIIFSFSSLSCGNSSIPDI